MQRPIPSGFGPSTTAAEVLAGIDLSGRQAIVTGGYSGIGVETVRALRNAGARVLVPSRDLDKAARTLDGIDAEVLPMDLTDPASIDAFVQAFLDRGQPLHLLINSAGVMACPLQRDARGYEHQFATNHLGHFQLTARLWPALKAANGARVVSLSSRGHHYSPVDFDDIHFERREYERWIAYGQSKTANSLFAVGLDARGREHAVRAFALHPGAIITELARYLSTDELKAANALDEHGQPITDVALGFKNVQQGAATSVWAATSAQLDGLGALYLEDCDIAAFAPEPEKGDAERRVGVRAYAVDPEQAERLWSISEVQTGVRWSA